MAKKKTNRTGTSARMATKYAEKNKPMSEETKKKLKIWLPIAAVVLIAIICVLALWPDGSLSVREIKQNSDETWLIVNKNTVAKPKYYKLAEVKAVDGFTPEEEWIYSSDEYESSFWMNADDTESPFGNYSIMTATKPANEIAENAFSIMGTYATKIVSDAVKTTTMLDRECSYFTYFHSSAYDAAVEAAKEAAGEDGEPEEVNPDDYAGKYSMCVYIPAVEDCSILLMVQSSEMMPTDPMDETTMLGWAEQAAVGIVLEVEEDK